MIGLIILGLLVLIQIIIMCVLVKNGMKYLKYLQTTQCKNVPFMCKNNSNWDLCKWVVGLSKDAAKFDENNPEPIYKDTCCGKEPNNEIWMNSINNKTDTDPSTSGFDKNCKDL